MNCQIIEIKVQVPNLDIFYSKVNCSPEFQISAIEFYCICMGENSAISFIHPIFVPCFNCDNYQLPSEKQINYNYFPIPHETFFPLYVNHLHFLFLLSPPKFGDPPPVLCDFSL